MKKTCYNCLFYKKDKDLDAFQDCWRGCPMVLWKYEACNKWQLKKDKSKHKKKGE